MTHLTCTVLAGGRILPAGTPREQAPDVPPGPWWSGPVEDVAPRPARKRTKG